MRARCMLSGMNTPARFGRYQVRRLLGEGGYGSVWLAHDPLLRRDVAVKVPRGPWLATAEVLAEARALAALAHPSVVQVLDAGLEGGTAFIVLEHVEGLSLEGVMMRSKGVVAPADAIRILEGPAAAVDHAHHRGVIHADLKPANLLAPLDGPVLGGIAAIVAPLKVVDLGVMALLVRGGGSAKSLGDPRYAAPEAWLGRPTKSSDVFSLAATFFHLVAGRPPLEGTARQLVTRAGAPERSRLRDVAKGAASTLDEALAAALHGDPSMRPASAGELMDVLREAVHASLSSVRIVRDARARIAARDEEPRRAACSACHRPLHPRAKVCPHCGETI
jgi:serine/threonine protein kinase